MNETIKAETIEQKIAITSEWIKNISENQEVREIPREILQSTLEYFGANFQDLSKEARESLSGYSEKERVLGTRSVWGNEVLDNYKSWVKKYIVEYDKTHNIKLPILGEKKDLPYPKSGRKNSGMIQFLYELTSFASGETSFDDFKTYMEARIRNGAAFAEGRKKDRIKVKVPTSSDPIYLGSIPQEFPIKAWEWITENGLK